MDLKSNWQGCFHFVYQPDDCLECCEVTADKTILGIGFWLYFSCCPLQGGSNLQPTHEPSSTLTLTFELNPKKLSCLLLDWASQWHYQSDEVAALLMVDPMHACGVSCMGFHQVLAGEEEDKEALIALK